MARRKKTTRSRGIGIAYLMKLTVLITVLMLINSNLIGQLVRMTVRLLPDILDDVRLYQFFQIFLPMIMVAIQFWIYDRWKDRRLSQMSVDA